MSRPAAFFLLILTPAWQFSWRLRRFVPAWMYHAFGIFIKIGYAEWRGPGVNGFLVAQDRYIKERGFQQVKVVKANNLRETYLTRKNAGRVMAGGYGIVIGNKE